MIELGELYISDECKRICEAAKRRAPGQAQLITAVLTIHFNVYDYLARALRGHDLLTLEVEQHLESLDLRGDTSYVHAIVSAMNPQEE